MYMYSIVDRNIKQFLKKIKTNVARWSLCNTSHICSEKDIFSIWSQRSNILLAAFSVDLWSQDEGCLDRVWAHLFMSAIFYLTKYEGLAQALFHKSAGVKKY